MMEAVLPSKAKRCSSAGMTVVFYISCTLRRAWAIPATNCRSRRRDMTSTTRTNANRIVTAVNWIEAGWEVEKWADGRDMQIKPWRLRMIISGRYRGAIRRGDQGAWSVAIDGGTRE